MAEAEIARVVGRGRGALAAARRHRRSIAIGRIAAGRADRLVGVAAAHRGEAFAAAEMLMDFLKTRAPFWKRAIRVDGAVEGWVEAKAEDDAQADAVG